MILRAPTNRSSQYAPSGSCGSSRDSFTPRFELWMNLSSPTYIPTGVTPAPGRALGGTGGAARAAAVCPAPPPKGAADHAAHPGARVVGRIQDPGGPAIPEPIPQLAAERQPSQRSPFDAPTHAPLGRELLRREIGRQTERHARERIRAERGPAAPRLQLIPDPVEGAAPAERVVHEHRGAEPVRERSSPPSQRRAGAEFVHVGAIAVVPAAQMKLHAAALPRQRRRHEQEPGPRALSQRPQQRDAPPTRAGPCGATAGAAGGA